MNDTERQNRTNGDVVVVINGDEIAELQVSSQRCGFTGNTLHSATISKEHEGMICQKIESGLVEDGSRVPLSDRETDCISKSLTKRSGRDLDTRSIMRLWMARSDAVNLLHK